MKNINPFLLTDSYKTGHVFMYPKGTSLVYCNMTPRSNSHAPKGCDELLNIGEQLTWDHIHELFQDNFFNVEKQRVCDEIKREYSLHLGMDYDTSHIEALHDLGYLPIRVKALPEGTLVPMRVPVMTIFNTLPQFFWLPNFLETLISNLWWKPSTSATLALAYKRNLLKWANKTDVANVGFVEFQGHDFSMRGLDSPWAAMASGIGHAACFQGSDSLPVIHGVRKYYPNYNDDRTVNFDKGIVYSVNATEHSVMCAGGKESEIDTFRRLLKTFPTGILSVVSDTWDLWKVCTEYLPDLKEEILARDGKLVIRPDSGDPVDIICGWDHTKDRSILREGGKLPYIEGSPQDKGVIELLWDVFGGTVNEQGYKVLDPHIGCIYGDSITLERQEAICERLAAKGFASTNMVFGIGSFTYQYNTRDTFGTAMKATYVEKRGTCTEFSEKEGTLGHPSVSCSDCNCIERQEIFKNPVTDDGIKKSAKGLLRVDLVDGKYVLKDQVSWEEEAGGELQVIYDDGEFFNTVTFDEIRERVNNLLAQEIEAV